MTKTKQTPHEGSSSHRPGGMVTARFTGAEKEAERQFALMPQGKKLRTARNGQDTAEEETGTSKSTGKAGDQPQQVEGGAEAPPEENPPPPQTHNPA